MDLCIQVQMRQRIDILIMRSQTKDDVAMLGQLDVGFTYHWSDRFRLTSGYRMVGVTGLSLTTNQLSQDLADLAEARNCSEQ